jgi:hypothetical protein
VHGLVVLLAINDDGCVGEEVSDAEVGSTIGYLPNQLAFAGWKSDTSKLPLRSTRPSSRISFGEATAWIRLLGENHAATRASPIQNGLR